MLAHRTKKIEAKNALSEALLANATSLSTQKELIVLFLRRQAIWQKRWNVSIEQIADIDSQLPSLEYSQQRAECLQSNLVGPKYGGGKWEKESIYGSQFAQDGDWVFQPAECPLMPFSERYMCQIALGCESVLIVGDSTTNAIYGDAHQLFLDDLRANSLASGSTVHWTRSCRGCVTGDKGCRPYYGITMHHRRICMKHCTNQTVKLSYVRHNHLVNHHGETYRGDLQCDEWKVLQSQYKYVWVSTGPHMRDLVEFPYGNYSENISGYLNLTAEDAAVSASFIQSFVTLFEKEANALVDTFLSGGEAASNNNITGPNRVLIYQTGHWGDLNFTKDCTVPPRAEFPGRPTAVRGQGEADRYYYELIPLLNEAYVRVLKHRLRPSQLLLLDVSDMLSMRYSCRNDPLHFSTKEVTSQAFRLWQLLYNLLLATNGNYL